jgi:hypothetical protein
VSDKDARPVWKRPIVRRASGIFQLRTAFWRRSQVIKRPARLWRPPLEASLCLLLFAVVLAAVAIAHRKRLDARFDALVLRGQSAPFEIQRIRHDLAALDLDEKALSRELDTRLAAAEEEDASDFYLVLDTKTKMISLRVGDRIVREAPLAVGPPRTIRTASGERVAEPPLSGAFTVRQKLERPSWKPPASVWTAAGLPVPSPPREIPGGLGRYVIVLAEDVVLHSPPPPQSPLQGPRPGSFEAPEADLAAIWKRVGNETRVYVF